MRKLLMSLVLTAIVALAADATGTWKATMETPNGSRDVVLKLKADGSALTGTISGRSGDTAIENGKVDGDNVSFTVTRKMQDREMKTDYKGTMSGDSMKLTFMMGDNQREMTAKRQ